MKRKSLGFGAVLMVMISVFAASVDAKIEKSEWKIWEGKLNINEASEADFALLDGIGKVTAHRIVEYRDKMGGFKSIAQLKEVKGVSSNRVKLLEANLSLFDKSNMKVLADINSAPESAMKALPGISKQIALSIVEYRDRNEGFEDLGELLQVPGVDRARFEEMKDFITIRPMKPVGKKAP
ncbi:MAG: helix-hairpin-helix domain-containing protein [bacterium]|nr:helix-hairpin-helix domain-containing protein [bacterium]